MRTNVSNKIRHFLELDPNSVTLYYKEHIKSIKVRIKLNINIIFFFKSCKNLIG